MIDALIQSVVAAAADQAATDEADRPRIVQIEQHADAGFRPVARPAL